MNSNPILSELRIKAIIIFRVILVLKLRLILHKIPYLKWLKYILDKNIISVQIAEELISKKGNFLLKKN